MCAGDSYSCGEKRGHFATLCLLPFRSPLIVTMGARAERPSGDGDRELRKFGRRMLPHSALPIIVSSWCMVRSEREASCSLLSHVRARCLICSVGRSPCMLCMDGRTSRFWSSCKLSRFSCKYMSSVCTSHFAFAGAPGKAINSASARSTIRCSHQFTAGYDK